jgi:hypothetical protein
MKKRFTSEASFHFKPFFVSADVCFLHQPVRLAMPL